jgi:hypothetical protein
MTSHKQVQPHKQQEVVPEYLKNYKGGEGLTQMGGADLVIPRIKLLQGLSPEPQAFESAKAGQYWHNVLNESLGTSFRFIVCFDRKRHILSVPLGGTPEGVLARSDDAVHWNPPNSSWEVRLPGTKKSITWRTKPTVKESGLDQYGSSDPEDPRSPPAAVTFYDYLCLLPDHPDWGPVLLSLTRSQLKKGRDLNAKIELQQHKRPMQGMVFKAGVINDKSPQGPFFNYAFFADGAATQEEYDIAKGFQARYGRYKAADEEGAAADAREPVESKEY